LNDPAFQKTIIAFQSEIHRLYSHKAVKTIERQFHAMAQTLEAWKMQFAGLGTAKAFRKHMVSLVDALIQKTCHGLSWSGTEQADLQAHQIGVCLISNHRSTSLDPVFVNYVLNRTRGHGAFNAAGDNIFNTPWLGHLIRLNRGFIVRRNVDDPDQKIAEAYKLSDYVKQILDAKETVWIAHRNGRSKDGTDQTDSAVLAMLKMSHPELDWQTFSQTRVLMPVAISWELVPLDLSMAQELVGQNVAGGMNRDMHNIFSEVIGEKGRVHIHFGQAVQASKRSDLVRGIDNAIHAGTRLFESNYLAYSLSQDCSPLERALISQKVDTQAGEWVINRGKDLEPAVHERFIGMYAAPVINAIKLHGSLAQVLDRQDNPQ
jgi:1-acyl-sn-glycerol-3-phosphate acyltransferase